MKKYYTLAPLAAIAGLLSGCATSHQVTSQSITSALDLDKADRFSLEVVDTSDSDTAFSDNAQEYASAMLIDDLEDDGLDYVGEQDPEIRFQFRTYAATEPTYIVPNPAGEIEITTVETRDATTGRIKETKTVTTVDADAADQRIYVGTDSRLFLLEAFDDETKALLWRGQMTIDDTGLTEDVLANAIEELTDRLEAET